MSDWAEHDLDNKLIEVLAHVPLPHEGHHLGRPFMTAYQVAIDFQRRFPNTVEAIGRPLGGSGIGGQSSLAQYLTQGLSRQVKAQGAAYPIEGAFLANRDVDAVTYRAADGRCVTSSVKGGQADLSLWRLRAG